MDNSILYGLRNPAMTDDIGMSMIERQFPTTMTSMSYVPADSPLPQINNGQPKADTYQAKREKEYSTIKKILVGLGVAALGIFGLKKGSKYVKQAYDYIAPHVKNIFTKGQNFVSNLYNKIKIKVSP